MSEARRTTPEGGPALIIGGAECVWRDLKALSMLVNPFPGPVIAVNDIGCHYRERIDHWVSMHPRNFPKWEAERARRNYPGVYETWGHDHGQIVDHVIETDNEHVSSSGLFGAALVAVGTLGLHAVLCGIPQTVTPHFVESRVHTAHSPWTPADRHWNRWLEWSDRLDGLVKSMSGRTRDLLGVPTTEWLDGGSGRVAGLVGVDGRE